MDALGNRMKLYEGREAQRRTLPRLPVLIRLDGKGFSKWTKGLQYPFDARMEQLRVEVMSRLVAETGALIAYGQSDEISLVLSTALGTEVTALYCDGRIQKLCSITASLATAWWAALVPTYLPEKAGSIAVFDSRVWEVPTLEEAANAILWRERDASKNSVSMAARSVYSSKEIFNKSSAEMQEMMFQKGINWNDYPDWAKRGTFVGRHKINHTLTPAEIDALPPLHNARRAYARGEAYFVQRSTIGVRPMPPFGKVANRVGVLLGDDPVVAG